MGKKMLIVHGYSDGSESFDGLGDFFVENAGYARRDIVYADYASMDDEATFRDFGDKLDEDYQRLFPGERIDVACHSTGALVVRAWLAVRYLRRKARRQDLTCPVKRLLMFAPANFGSDLAGMGQSFLGKFRTTFFNPHSHKREDFLESGKRVLQGLEPASPFQWDLSTVDLGSADSYFAAKAPAKERCYPFVFAAGDAYGGLQAKLIKKRKKPGTDGTVRIAGTSLNARRCRLSLRADGSVFSWEAEHKYEDIPFAVFAGFNHGTLVHPEKSAKLSEAFVARHGPGRLALEALKVTSFAKYEEMAKRFRTADQANFEELTGKRQARYQQYFFRVRDDVDLKVDDYFVDFYVTDSAGRPHRKLTERFDSDFEQKFYRHSDDASCRVLMLNMTNIDGFVRELRQAGAKLVFDITAKPPLPNVHYQQGLFIVYDGAKARGENPNFIVPNTTFLVDVIMNRRAASKVLSLSAASEEEVAAAVETGVGETVVTGRAALLQ